MPISPANDESKAAETNSPFRKWAGLGVLSLGLAIIIIDTTLLNVSLSTIIKDLHTDLQSLQWVITAYALVLAALTITGGRLGDLYGRKKMFMLGAIIFACGSFLASVSHLVPTLLLGESVIEGLGAALMMPATASLVVANFKGKDRAMAFGIWGAVAGASSAIGPLLGGYLTSHYSWRWGFRINIFVAAAVVIGSLWLIKESRDEHRPKLDWLGVFLSSLGLFSIVFGIIESTTYGWWKAKAFFHIFGRAFDFYGLSIVPVALFMGFLLLAVFVWWELRMEKAGKSPLVSMGMFKIRQFSAGVGTISILSLGMTGMVFALPVFLQSVKNLDALHTGLALLPLSVAILVVAPLTGALTKKYEPRYFIQAGLLINMLAAFILRRTINLDVTVAQLIPGLAVYGLGMGMVFAPISNLILSAVPIEQSGEASGVNNTLRQVGGSLGAAIIGAAILTSLTGHLSAGIKASPVIPEAYKAPIIRQVDDPNSDVEFGGQSGAPAGAPAAVAEEIRQLVSQASTRATQDAYIYAGLFSFIGFLIALFLPKMHGVGDVESKISSNLYLLAAGAAAAGIIGAGLLLQKSAKTVIATGAVPQPSIEQIRGLFVPPAGQSGPKQNARLNPPVAASSSPNINARGELALDQTPNPDQTPSIKNYSYQTLGFTLSLNNGWQARANAQGSVVFANKDGRVISIQSYPAQGQTLSDIKQQLSGSPSVRDLSAGQFKNLPALEFTANGQKALAVIGGSRVFYIFGVNFLQESNFSFLPD